MQEIVVTATRLPTPLGPGPRCPCDHRDDIRLRQASFAFDVLSTLPACRSAARERSAA
ncbi:MAG: hypothetical protein WDM92_05145 [Caulobacteraceae bacterium]